LVVPLNFTVRYYDPFAALGYTALFGAVALPSPPAALGSVGLVALVLYYVCGAARKLQQRELPDRAHLVGRSVLAVCYAAHLVGVA
jgi:hypothetical protein